MRAGLTNDQASSAIFCMGRVRSYNPGTNTYRIGLDGKSEGVATPITSGVYKPYPINTRVACIRFSTSGWLILGEVSVAKAPTKDRESPAGTVYEKDLELRNALHDRYSIDMANFGDSVLEPPLEGDAVLSNRDDPRSYIQVYENGDILSLASNFCFSLLSRAKNLAVTWAKDCWAIFAGCSVKVETDDNTKKASTTISINSDPTDESDRDVEIVAGAISNSNRPTKNISTQTIGGTLSEGVWALFGLHSLLEVDNQAKEVRLSKVDIQSGKDVSTKDVQFRMNEDQIEVVWDTGKFVFEDDFIYMDKAGSQLFLDQSRISLKRGNNFIVVSDSGIKISGTLELAGGNLRFDEKPGETDQKELDGGFIDVPKETVGAPNITYAIPDKKTLEISGSGEVSAINLNTDFSVRNFALVDERFLTKYDTDMNILKTHEHISTTPGSPTTPLGVLQTIDVPPAAASKTNLTTKKA
jgi:hypothetical protein